MIADFAFLQRPPLSDLLALLNDNDAETRLVGGAVRNALMRLPPGDIDLATTLHPKQVLARASGARLQAIPTGLAHGTVTVMLDHAPVEVTTLRTDVATDGRHAEVAFGTDWTVDAQRRDFTMNAVYAETDGRLFDPVGGIADIQAKHLRFIGDPQDRIREDYLRILRYFRFHAGYADGSHDDAVLSVIAANLDGLVRVSSERVRVEVMKLLPLPKAGKSLDAMQRIGLLRRLLGVAGDLDGFARIGRFLNRFDVPAEATTWVWRLGALLGAKADAPDMARRLRLSNAERDCLSHFIQGLAEPLDASRTSAEMRAHIYQLGKLPFLDRLAGTWVSEREPDVRSFAATHDILSGWTIPSLPVSGADLLAAGFKPGPDLGQVLGQLEQMWIASDFTLDRDALLEQATALP